MVEVIYKHYHYNNNNINIKAFLDKGKGYGELLTKKTFEAIKNETLATIFAMAQQNSIKFGECELTFKQDLYVYFINIIL